MALQTTLRIKVGNRLRWDGVGRGGLRGHLHGGLQKLGELGLRYCRIDTGGTWPWNGEFQIRPDCSDPRFPHRKDIIQGSCIDGKLVGWGCRITDGDVIQGDQGSFGEKATAFRGEVHAIT